MCKWMASDNDFFVLRRFGQIAARVLLRMQDRIAKLEEDLRCLDQVCMEAGLNNGTFRYEPKLERNGILDELSWRLEQYRTYKCYWQVFDADLNRRTILPGSFPDENSTRRNRIPDLERQTVDRGCECQGDSKRRTTVLGQVRRPYTYRSPR